MPIRYLVHYFRTTARLLFHPGKFFAAMPPEGRVVFPLVFAIGTHWLASFASYFWKSPMLRLMKGGLQDGLDLWHGVGSGLSDIDSPGRHVENTVSPEAWAKVREVVLPWLWGSSSVLLDPFITLATLFATAMLVFVGARVLIDSQSPIRFSGILRLVCFASTPILWSIVPVIGAVIAPVAIVATTTIALVEVHRTSFVRALSVALFPKVALALTLLAGFVAVGWMAFKTLAAFFGAS